MAELFDDVLGDAISIAVRRACDDVGRAPFGELGDPDPAPDEPAAELDVEEIELWDTVPPPPEFDDPYDVLGLPRGASWERITAAHRRLARAWHPDGASADQRGEREELIRRLNVAYAELKVRRGR